ncbi:MAG TPA: alpha/beta hydrolase [Steroidobacteraceae bacterium]|jgi:pimeloyl-ACP methyl ester carboxylesterase
MLNRRSFAGLLTAIAAASFIPGIVQAQNTAVAKNVVLVHGLYADGSSWIDVIPYLQRAGLHVTAVQNPLTSLADDVAATRRVLASQDGPTVLVGHSFAGTIISEAGNDPKVSALVYVAARAPDAGEDFGALAAKFPKPPASAGVIKQDGFFWLSEEAFLRDFAGDVEPSKARALYAVQGRGADALPNTKTTTAAWKVKPTWYQVSTEDRTINPEFERFLAKRMNATTIELASSHVSLVSHPKEIADLILLAAGHKKSQ